MKIVKYRASKTEQTVDLDLENISFYNIHIYEEAYDRDGNHIITMPSTIKPDFFHEQYTVTREQFEEIIKARRKFFEKHFEEINSMPASTILKKNIIRDMVLKCSTKDEIAEFIGTHNGSLYLNQVFKRFENQFSEDQLIMFLNDKMFSKKTYVLGGQQEQRGSSMHALFRYQNKVLTRKVMDAIIKKYSDDPDFLKVAVYDFIRKRLPKLKTLFSEETQL